MTAQPFAFVAAGHEDCVVNSGAELDGADANWCDEGESLTGVEAETEIDENGRFDDGDKNEWKRDASGGDGNDDKNSDDRNSVDDLEIDRSKVDHVLSRGGLADKESMRIVFFDDAIDAFDLLGDFF